MKYLMIVCLCLCACAKPQSVAVPHADVGECNKLYSHVITLAIDNQFDREHEYSPRERQALFDLLDQEYRASGNAGKMYSYCLSQMTNQQLTCSLHAQTLESVNLCQ